MRLLTYNVHYWAGPDGHPNVQRVIRVLREARPDVIGLNEVLHPWRTPNGPLFPLLDIAAALEMHWAFGPSFEQTGPEPWTGLLGNAVLSRYPIRDVQNILLQPVPWRKPRSVLRVVMDIDGRPLEVLVTHLEHLLVPVRTQQFQRLSLVLRTVKGPHVLMGDFNTHTPTRSRVWPGEPLVRQLRSLGYVDAFAAVDTGDGRSYPSRLPLARLDYIWIPRRWRTGLKRAWVLATPTARAASDHFPVVVDWASPVEGPVSSCPEVDGQLATRNTRTAEVIP